MSLTSAPCCGKPHVCHIHKIPADRAEVSIAPEDNGGVIVTIRVPTYSGEVELVTTVERDQDGDWRVFLPDVDEFEVANNVIYLGGRDE